MATVTSVLETVLTIAGVGAVTQGMAGVAKEVLNMAAAQGVAKVSAGEMKAAQELLLAPLAAVIAESQAAVAVFIETAAVALGAATAETAMAAATAALEAALVVLTGPLGVVIIALSAIVATTLLAAKAFNEFHEVQDIAFRTGVILNNVKGAIPLGELQALGAEIQKMTGFDDDLIVSLGGVLTKFGVAAKDIPNVAKAIANAAAGSGQDIGSIGEIVGRALLPGGRGAVQFSKLVGEQFKATGDRAKDTAKAIELLNSKFAGGGAARRDTITGAFDSLKNAMGNLFSAIGRFFAQPIFIKIINFLADRINEIASGIEAIADFAARIGLAAGSNPAAGVGGKTKGDPEQTALLEEIAGNTSKLDDLVKGVFGESGEAARTGFSLRDARMAFGA